MGALLCFGFVAAVGAGFVGPETDEEREDRLVVGLPNAGAEDPPDTVFPTCIKEPKDPMMTIAAVAKPVMAYQRRYQGCGKDLDVADGGLFPDLGTVWSDHDCPSQ